MRKKAVMLLGILLLALLPERGFGETQRYSIRDLPAVTSPRWQQAYAAHGRIISVDVEVEIPQAEAAPVLLVRAAPPVEPSLAQTLEDFCAQGMRTDKVNAYFFTSTNFSTAFDHATPPMWGKTRESDAFYDQETMGWQSHFLTDYALDAAYAEDNPLPLGEAVAIAKEQVAALFPNDALRLTNVATFDRTYNKKTQQFISEKGYYHLEFHQIFRGIPFMGSVHKAFSRKAVGNENYTLEYRGCASADVFDADAFLFVCWFYQEESVLHPDIPLIPFDAAKSKVEALIQDGYVRAVDTVTLGYVQFDTENEQVQALVPAWVIWCEYQQEGPAAERSAPFYTDGWSEGEPYYRPLIINAQTGELLNPENEEYGRCMVPDIIV